MLRATSPVRRSQVLTASAILLLSVSTGQAGPTPEQHCQAAKNRTMGKYAACRAKAEGKLAASGDATSYTETITKCDEKFARSWQRLEDKAVTAGTACPSVGDANGIATKVMATTDTVAALVGGLRFVDNGDGTVTDHQTGLQWEKKDNPDGIANLANPHDVDNVYSWSSSGTAPDGTAYTDFLNRLNACLSADGTTELTAFAGHCDWRLPTIAELKTILLAPYPCGTNPCIDPIFGPTFPIASKYWSSITFDSNVPDVAWGVFFTDGIVTISSKSSTLFARAVRGG